MKLTLKVGDTTILDQDNVTATQEQVFDGANYSDCHVIRESGGATIYAIADLDYPAATDPNGTCVIGGVKIELR